MVTSARPIEQTFWKDYLGGRRFLIDAALYVPSRAAPALTSAAILIAATLVLNPAEVGKYGLTIATVLLAASIAGAWVDQSALKHYSQYKASSREENFIAAHSRLVLLVTLLCFVICAIVGSLSIFFHAQAAFVIPCVVLIPTYVIFTSAQTLLMARGRVVAYGLIEVCRSGITLVFAMAVLFVFHAGGPGLLWAALGGTLLSLPLAAIHAKLDPLRGGGILEYRMIALRYGLPLMGWVIGSQILAVSDRYIVEWLRGPTEVGIYHANYQLMPGLLTLALAPLILAAHSLILRGAATHPENSEEIIKNFTRYFMHLAAPIVLVLLCLSKPITLLAVGPAFQTGYVVAPFVIIGLLGWNLAAVGQKRFEIAGQTRLMLGIVAMCAAVNVILTFALVYSVGYVGAAIATLISYWLYPILLYVWPYAPLKWRIPWRGVSSALLSVAVGGLAGSWVARHLPFGVRGTVASLAVGLAVYAGGILISGDLLPELLAIRKMIKPPQLGSR